MSTLPEVLLAAATALGIGLMVGLERERRKGNGADREPVGLRTCAIAALLGLVTQLMGSTMLLSATVLALALLAGAAYRRHPSADPGITSEVALLLTTCLGARALTAPAEAAALGVVLTVLLALKGALHDLVKRWLSQHEVHDGLMLATAALVILPLLPDRGIGTGGAINPHQIGQFTVLLMAFSTLGHLATRLGGSRMGGALAGLLGGFVSSTATIASLGAHARQAPERLAAAVTGALLSTVATLLQMALLLKVGAPDLFASVWPALVTSGVICLGYTAGFLRRTPISTVDAAMVASGRLFDLRLIVVISGVISGMSWLSVVLLGRFGAEGLTVAALLAGLADAHAMVISIALLVHDGALPPHAATLPLLAVFASNTVVKCVVAAASGGSAYFWRVAPGLLLVVGVLATTLRLTAQ